MSAVSARARSGRSAKVRRPDESEEAFAERLEAMARLREQAWSEVAYAAAARGLSMAELSRRVGYSGTSALSGEGGMTLDRLASIGHAMGMEFQISYRKREEQR